MVNIIHIVGAVQGYFDNIYFCAFFVNLTNS